MATGTNGIATSAEVYKLIYGNDVPNASSATNCPTKSRLTTGYTVAYDGSTYYRIEAGDVSIPSSYSNDQCVKYSDITVTRVPSVSKTFTIYNRSDLGYSGSMSIKRADGSQILSLNIGGAGSGSNSTSVYVSPDPNGAYVEWSASNGNKYVLRGYYGVYVNVPYGSTYTLTSWITTWYFENA